jgi:hypothetical protein
MTYRSVLHVSLVSLCIVSALIFYSHNSGYQFKEVVLQPGLTSLTYDSAESIKGAKRFSELLVNEYRSTLRKQVHTSFKSSFSLWGHDDLSVKVVFSKIAETLMYIFPASERQLIAEGVPIAIQTALFAGFIDLTTPKSPAMSGGIRSTSLPEVAAEYERTPAKVNMKSGINSMIYGIGEGGLSITGLKFMTFEKNSSLTFYGGYFGIDNSYPEFIRWRGYAVRSKTKLEGPLIVTGERNFSWGIKEVAQDLGRRLAEADIIELITVSKFFRESLAHEKLRPQAEKILHNKSRTEKDLSFRYPFWEFESDLQRLYAAAKPLGVETKFVDDLLIDPSLKAHIVDGSLLFYYPDPAGFMWQWTFINVAFSLMAGILWLLNWTGYLHVGIMKLFVGSSLLQSLLPIAITSINGYVLTLKPAAITFPYWILPGLSYFACIFILVALTQRVRSSK